jgi:hypothetical protein
MRKNLLSILALLCMAVSSAWAQYDSHWPDFNGYDYNGQGVLVAAIQIDGVTITSEYEGWDALEIAYFVGDECRGNGICLYNGYVEEYDDPFPIIDGDPIFYNNAGEQVSFKMYDHINGILYEDCEVTLQGEPLTILTGEDHMEGWDDPENPVILSFTTPEPSAPATEAQDTYKIDAVYTFTANGQSQSQNLSIDDAASLPFTKKLSELDPNSSYWEANTLDATYITVSGDNIEKGTDANWNTEITINGAGTAVVSYAIQVPGYVDIGSATITFTVTKNEAITAPKAITIAGTKDLTGTEEDWQIVEANNMAKNDETGLYEWTAENVVVNAGSMPQFKVVVTDSEDKQTWVPASEAGNDHNWVITPDVVGGEGVFTITITFNVETQEIAVTGVLNEIATGITAVAPVKPATVVFNLSGQRVTNAQKGLYIVNGKKVVVK